MNERISVKAVVKAIGIPSAEWEGRCAEIASKLLKTGLVQGKSRYGIWLGKISEGSVFSGRPFTHHGWIEKSDGTIVDPTRWVFEGAKPYIFVGKNYGEYDFGGNRLLEMQRKPFPEGSGDIEATFPDWLEQVCGRRRFTFEQLLWIANTPLHQLCDPKAVYSVLIKIGHGSAIPIDNRRAVMGERKGETPC